MKLILVVVLGASLWCPSHSKLVVLRPPHLDEFFLSSSRSEQKLPDPLPKMWLGKKLKLCADLATAKIFRPRGGEYQQLSQQMYAEFPKPKKSQLKYSEKTVHVGDSPVQLNVLSCFVSEEMQVYISYGFVAPHYYFVFAKVGINASIKLVGLAEESPNRDNSLRNAKALKKYFLKQVNINDGSRGDANWQDTQNNFLSLTPSENFRLCGLVYDCKVPTATLKTYSIVNDIHWRLVDLTEDSIAKHLHSVVLQCKIYTSENHQAVIYIIPDPKSKHGVFSAQSVEIELPTTAAINVLQLIEHFKNVSPLYKTGERYPSGLFSGLLRMLSDFN